MCVPEPLPHRPYRAPTALVALTIELALLAWLVRGPVEWRPLVLLLIVALPLTVTTALHALGQHHLWGRYCAAANRGLVVVLAAFLVLLATNIAALLQSPFSVLEELEMWSWEVSLLVPTPTKLFRLTADGITVRGQQLPFGGGWSLKAYFLLLWGAILLSLVTVIRRAVPLLTDSWGKLVERPRELVEMGNMYVLTTALGLLVAVVAWSFNAEPLTPEDDLKRVQPWLVMFFLANASVWEEVQGRILMLGVPLLLVHRIMGKHQPVRRYLLGGDLELDPPGAALMFLSAIFFAYLHVIHGWDWWKFPTSLLAGLMFGYLFLRYGVASSILFHFAFDYAAIWSYIENDEASALANFFAGAADAALWVLLLVGLAVLPLVVCRYIQRHLEWWRTHLRKRREI